MRRVYPLPEAIAGDRWTIDPGAPRCAPRDRHMWIPLAPDPHMAVIRAHELAHARFTPPNARRPRVVPEPVLQAVEDGRVNYLATRAGVSFAAGPPPEVRAAAIAFTGSDWRRAALLLTSALDGDDLRTLAEAFARMPYGEHAIGLARQARAMLGARLPRAAGAPWSYARALYVARWLAEQLARDPETFGTPDGIPWGHMTIQYPRLDRPALRRVASTAEGALLRAPWRLTSDGAVFRATKIPRHGSVLIDASGSMGLSPADVAALARTLPAGIVAAYGAAQPDSGVLRVLARRGVVASDLGAYACGVHNVIDGPALRWLAAQPAPRVWVSDGAVTGISDQPYPDCSRDADQIVSTAGIVRLPDVPAALAHFHRRR